jgi:hypothetical protein
VVCVGKTSFDVKLATFCDDLNMSIIIDQIPGVLLGFNMFNKPPIFNVMSLAAVNQR